MSAAAPDTLVAARGSRREAEPLRSSSHVAASDAVLRARWEAVAVAAVVAVGYWLTTMSDLLLAGAFRDDGAYLALGRAIAMGDGYRSIYLAGNPAHLKYPPALPALFAALWSVGHTLSAVRELALVLDILAVAAAAGMLWWIGRARLELRPVYLAAFAIGALFFDAAIQYNTLAIAEPYYLLGWAAALLLFQHLREAAPGVAIRRGLALGLVLAVTTLFRSEGVVLIAAIMIALVVNRMPARVAGAVLGATLLPLAGWWLLHRHLIALGPRTTQPDEIPYGAFLLLGGHKPAHALWATVAGNARDYARGFAAYLSGVSVVGYIAELALLTLGVTGCVWEARRRPALVASAAGTTMLILLWPFPQDRFVLTILPFAGVLVASAVERIVRRAPAPAGHAVAAAVILAAGLFAIRQIDIRRRAVTAIAEQRLPGLFTPSYVLAANSRSIAIVSQWVLAHTAPTDRVLSSNHTGVYLYTGRAGVPSDPAQNRGTRSVYAVPGEYLARRAVEDRVTIVVADNRFSPLVRDIAELHQRCPASLIYLGSAAPGPVPAFYRIHPDDACLRTIAGGTRE